MYVVNTLRSSAVIVGGGVADCADSGWGAGRRGWRERPRGNLAGEQQAANQREWARIEGVERTATAPGCHSNDRGAKATRYSSDS